MRWKPDVSRNKPVVQRRFPSLIVIILNIALLAFAFMSYGRYATLYQERLREENLGNIANLNQSSAFNTTALIESWSVKLEDIAEYVTQRDMTHDEALAYIEQSNSSLDRYFELIGDDYTGFSARRGKDGGFIPLSYEKSGYADLQEAFNDVNDSAYDDICFAPEFTDGDTALKYFAIYKHLTLKNENGVPETYTLLLAKESASVLAVFNNLYDFEGQSTVLMDSKGNYIVSNKDFKSANFFQYLYVYNDLTLDVRNEIERVLTSSGSGELYYKNAKAQDCVFRYQRMATNGWYCITCVPISSFRTSVININYTVYAVVALILLLVLDVAWFQAMNNRLRVSVQREKEASDAKTDFLSRMSHDIRTPLNGIIGLTALAKDETDPDVLREYLDKVTLSGQFLAGLVNDILDLSKVESGKIELNPEPYSCKDMYQYVEAIVVPLCKDKNQTFIMSPPDDEPPVLLDRLRFNQIIFNLLSNAVKYTPSGGEVELSWKRAALHDNVVSLDIVVRDNGIGMSEEFQKHMFESFTQERHQATTHGSGLGLAIVRSLVGLMNGQISVESKKDVGSTFTVHLEATVCASAPELEQVAERNELVGRHILLCDDNQINTMIARRLLEKWGIVVDTASNGRQGLEMFDDSPIGDYDAILMDIMMPEMNGLQAAAAIRALGRSDARTVPIIAMTANAYDTDVQNCLEAGMNAHIGKPIDTAQLHKLLTEMLKDKG